jgi:uncharacterized LabA/DUF88 family protein
MLRKIIAIDSSYANIVARQAEFRHFPVDEFRQIAIGSGGVDVIETLITVNEFPPEDDSPEAVATASQQSHGIRYALEMNGCRVIRCPAKKTHGGDVKQSDDQRLMITTLSTCLRLKPDFLLFVAADGDYAPMIWELRYEGIRTEVVANAGSLANDLKRAAYSVIDVDDIFNTINHQRTT